MRIDKYLADQYPDWTRSRLQKLIESQKVTINGKPVKSNYKLKPGQSVDINWPKPVGATRRVAQARPSPGRPAGSPLQIIHEDDDIIVVNKPPGMVVHPSAGHEDGNTLIELLESKIDADSWPDEARRGLVHRLDRDTSGVIVFAKTPLAQSKISKQFSLRQVSKVYYGLVEGVPKAKSGTLESRIARHPGQRQRYAVSQRGRWALTKYHLKKSWGDKASWLEIRPFTGRTHQIRVQLAAFGHPIWGDHIYGNKHKMSFSSRQMLHAYQLTLTHPQKGQKMNFEAAVPSDFHEAIKLIRLNI